MKKDVLLNGGGEARTSDGHRAKTDGKIFLCAIQLAERWGWNVESIRRAIRQGRIPSKIISRRHLIPVDAVELIEANGLAQ